MNYETSRTCGNDLRGREIVREKKEGEKRERYCERERTLFHN